MQRTPQSTTSRQQILLTQHQAETLEALAESEGVSKSEIVRRALARYPGHEAIDDEEAAAVLAELSEALDHAIASVAATVEQLRRESQRLHDEQRELDRRLVRIETLVELAMQRHPLPPGGSG